MSGVTMTVQAARAEGLRHLGVPIEAAGELAIDFDPLSAAVRFDYSQPDSLGVSLEGRWKLSNLDASIAARLGLDHETVVTGSLGWQIHKDVAAHVEVTQKGARGTLSIRF